LKKGSLKLWASLVLTSAFHTATMAQTDKSVSLPQLVTGKKNITDTTKVQAKRSDQTDLPDVIHQLFHTKTSPQPDSVTTKPEISIVPAIGYTLVSKFAIVLSGNIAFRTGPQSRISTIVASASYTQNKQFIMPVLSSIWTKNNKFNFVGDLRYYQYPQSTYGLGSSSSVHSEDPMDFSFARFYETALRHVTGNWYAGLGYAIDNYWNVSQKGNINGTVSDYSKYGEFSHSISSGLTLNVIHDSRDNSINPIKGWYGSVQYRDNREFLGSTQDWESLIIDLRKYIRFPAGSDNVLALWSYDWLILGGKPSYLNLPSTSWDPNTATGRGYIQGRFRGAQMVYAESEYRFKITNNGLLGGVVFANAQSLSAQQGTKLQAIQPAFGPGVRLKLNKTSRTNIAVDYGFGREGSRGLFIDVGEIF
jgi:hypothetical protein